MYVRLLCIYICMYLSMYMLAEVSVKGNLSYSLTAAASYFILYDHIICFKHS